MKTIRPVSAAGVAALAYALKLDACAHYWETPEGDRDWDILKVTQFVDHLIELGMPRAA